MEVSCVVKGNERGRFPAGVIEIPHFRGKIDLDATVFFCDFVGFSLEYLVPLV